MNNIQQGTLPGTPQTPGTMAPGGTPYMPGNDSLAMGDAPGGLMDPSVMDDPNSLYGAPQSDSDPISQMMSAMQNNGAPQGSDEFANLTDGSAPDETGATVEDHKAKDETADVVAGFFTGGATWIAAIAEAAHHSAGDYARRIDPTMQAHQKDVEELASGSGGIHGIMAQHDLEKKNRELYIQANKVEDAVRKQELNVTNDEKRGSSHLQKDQNKLQGEIQQFQKAAGSSSADQALVNKAIDAGLLDVKIDNAAGVSNPGGQNRFFTNNGDKNGSMDPTMLSLGALAENSKQIEQSGTGDGKAPSIGAVEAYINQNDSINSLGTGANDSGLGNYAQYLGNDTAVTGNVPTASSTSSPTSDPRHQSFLENVTSGSQSVLQSLHNSFGL